MTEANSLKLRPIHIELGWNEHSHGSSFYSSGDTRILCSMFLIFCSFCLYLVFHIQSSFGPKEKERSTKSQEAELKCTVSRISLSSSASQSLKLTFADPEKSRAHQTFSTTDIAIATETVAPRQRLITRKNVKEQAHSVLAQDSELSQRIVTSLRTAIRGEVYNKSSIEIAIVILQDDGCLSLFFMFILLFFAYCHSLFLDSSYFTISYHNPNYFFLL